MSLAAALRAEALAAGLVLTSDGERLHVESPLGPPLRPELRERLRAHRDEMLGWLGWSEIADVLLLETSVRLARCRPSGCPLEDAAWLQAEEALSVAYETQGLVALKAALADYERFACNYFVSFKRGASP